MVAASSRRSTQVEGEDEYGAAARVPAVVVDPTHVDLGARREREPAHAARRLRLRARRSRTRRSSARGTKLFDGRPRRATSPCRTGDRSADGATTMNAQERAARRARASRGRSRTRARGGGRRATSPSSASGAAACTSPSGCGRSSRGALGVEPPLGTLDIALYRDDVAEKGAAPVVGPDRHPLPGRRARPSSSSTTCSTPAAPSAPRSTSSSTSAGRGACGSRCSSTAAGASCPSPPTSSGARLEVADGDDVQVRLARGRRAGGRGRREARRGT